ncbi:hypothetical protein pb186bvf_007442 [Paramecium bursaria]
MMTLIAIFCIIVTTSQSRKLQNRKDLFEETTKIAANKETFWFDQKLDHADSFNQQTFRQRYHVYSDSVKDNKPTMVVLYICGEWTCDGIGEGQFPFVAAQRYNGVILVLEHRYFGQTQPFKDWSTSNLKYLNIHQALDDIAYFIQQIKSKGLHNINSTIPWIHMGGSYPGALSAWFRYKYPHLTIGGLASSAVVKAVTDYYMYDYQVYVSAAKSGQDCVDSILEVNNYIEAQLKVNRQEILKTFDAESLSDIEFLSMIADIYAGMVQGRQRSKMCKNLDQPTFELKFQAVVNMSKQTVDQESYGSEFLKNQTINFNSASRQWTYQTCTEVGYFQTANIKSFHTTRSAQLQIDFFDNLCAYSYGVPIFPDDERTNNYYGGTDIKVTNLIFSNGSDDPWQHASIITEKNGLTINYIDCLDCSHCVDLKSPAANDPPELTAARQKTLLLFDQWIKEYNQYKVIEQVIEKEIVE